MRRVSSLLALSVTFALGASASSASILTFDSKNEWNRLKDPRVSEDVAQLVLEHRMKSADSSFLGNTDEDTVKLLNMAGGTPPSLFGVGTEDDGSTKKSILVLEGIHLKEDHVGDLFIPRPSSTFVDDDFVTSLLKTKAEAGIQAARRLCTFHAKDGPIDSEAAGNCLIEHQSSQELSKLYSKEFLDYVDSLEFWADESKSTAVLRVSLKPQAGQSDGFIVDEILKPLFRGLSTPASRGEQITTVILPGSQDRSQSRHSLRPREVTGVSESPVTHWQTPRIQNSASIPSTLTPVCHASEASCTDATNNCSGHGVCYKKSGSGAAGAAGDCYACRCQETTVKKADGSIQKIRWGGPACQKKDISSPFFLITGVSILIVAAVGTAIATLFSIGQDELPGVISAGVGAPRAQK